MNKPTPIQITQTLKRFTTDIDSYFGNYQICLERIHAVISLTVQNYDTYELTSLVRDKKHDLLIEFPKGIPICELDVNNTNIIFLINNPLNISDSIIIRVNSEDKENMLVEISQLLETINDNSWDISSRLPDYPNIPRVDEFFNEIISNTKKSIGLMRKAYKSMRSVIKYILNELEIVDDFIYSGFRFGIIVDGSEVTIFPALFPWEINNTYHLISNNMIFVSDDPDSNCLFNASLRKFTVVEEDDDYAGLLLNIVNILKSIKHYKKPSSETDNDNVEE